jgi:hypothetical protein
MSKTLDDILNDLLAHDAIIDWEKSKQPEAKAEIKALFLEIIGNSDLAVANFPGLTNDNMARNGLRAELRRKLEAL